MVLNSKPLLTLIAEDMAALKGLAQVVDIFRFTLAVGVAQTDHLFAEAAMVATAGINQDHLTKGFGMLINKAGQQFGMVSLIQQVAADNEIKLTQAAILIAPARMDKGDVVALIEGNIFLEEILSLGVIVGGSDVGMALIKHQTCQADAAAHLKDALAGNIKIKNKMGQDLT